MRKGQVVTEEMKEKAKVSKLNNFISKLKWELVEPYLDVNLLGNKSRIADVITFRKFKEFIFSGKNIEDMEKLGIRPKLLCFMSNFLQNKIILPKDVFESEYLKGRSLDEIRTEYNITKSDMSFLRELYGIKQKGAEFINRKKTEIPLTDRQKKIIIGSLMGDAKKMSPTSVGFGHGPRQIEYILWKFKELINVSSVSSFKKSSYIDKRNNRKGETWRFYTKANTDLENINFEFYNSGKKQVSRSILNQMDDLSVAVWFMDDGKTDWKYRYLKDKNINHRIPSFEFCTESFSKESCDEILKWFDEKWNIKCRLQERKLKDSVGYRIVIKTESAYKFLELIQPHIIDSMKYKTDYKVYLSNRIS